MAKYRVFAECVSDYYLDVEADSEEEAKRIADEADGGKFIPCESGDWKITSANLLDSGNNESPSPKAGADNNWIQTDDYQFCRKIDDLHYELVEAVETPEDGKLMLCEPDTVAISDYLNKDGTYTGRAEEIIRMYHSSVEEFDRDTNGSIAERNQILAEMIYETELSQPVYGIGFLDEVVAVWVMEEFAKTGEALDIDAIFEYGGKHFYPKGKFEDWKYTGSVIDNCAWDDELGFHRFDTVAYPQKFAYDWDLFYQAAKGANDDVFLCIEYKNVYTPGSNTLYRWLGDVN